MESLKEQIWFIQQEVRIGNLSEFDATNQILNLIIERVEGIEQKDYKRTVCNAHDTEDNIYKAGQNEATQAVRDVLK